MLKQCNKYWFDIYKEDLSLLRGILHANGIDVAYLTDFANINSKENIYQVMFYAESLDLESLREDCKKYNLKGPPAFSNVFSLKCQKLILDEGE